MRYYCTYFDKGYLVRALALYRSLLRHERQPFTLYMVCLDELTRTLVNRLGLPHVITVPLHDIEHGDEALRQARGNRSQVEYYWTLTPTVILRLLERYPAIDVLTYLDADLFFFSAPEPIFAEFSGYSVLIHEHRFHEAFKPAIKYGRFNVGLLCFRRDRNALEVLHWWRDRCNEWCYCRLEEGRYGDQLYLDSWPERFSGVRVLEHIGAGVAPWNNLQYRYAADSDGRVTVDGLPLVFYHFHALTFSHPRYVVLSKLPAHNFPLELVRLCYLPYVCELHAELEKLLELHPTFACGVTGAFLPGLAAILLDADTIQFNMPPDTAPPRMLPLSGRYSLLSSGQILPETDYAS